MPALQGKDLQERFAAAGGVSKRIVDAFRSVLTDSKLDGAFAAAALTLPSSAELYPSIPEADPLVLHEARWGLLARSVDI